MFDSLSARLSDIFSSLGRKGHLKESDITKAMRDIRLALLQADVALPVVKHLIEKASQKAQGEDVLRSISPSQQIVKIIHDQLVDLLGKNEPINLQGSPPISMMMVGLQGSGKTTSTGKLAHHLCTEHGKKVLVSSLDIYRPAAQEQLEVLAKDCNFDSVPIIPDQSPLHITERTLEMGRTQGYDVILFDTAGRLHIDDELMDELQAIEKAVNPHEVFFVGDAMTGQDALTAAQSFSEKIGLTGIVLTRVDGDSRAGAALSMRHVTNMPIKFMGTGEKIHQWSLFHPDRLAQRILGMGDIISLVEKTAQTIEKDKAEKLAKKMSKGQFDLNDYQSQLKQIQKMGSFSSLMGMIPGLGNMKSQLKNLEGQDAVFKIQESIIQSMTPQEKTYPALIKSSRKKRIAKGCGRSVQDINKLLKQHQKMEKVIKKVGKKGLGAMGSNDALKNLMNAMPSDGTEMGKKFNPNMFLNHPFKK